MDLNFIKSLKRISDTKIVFLIIDGLGGLPYPPSGETELEKAETPNLDNLAAQGICGLQTPVATGITPGSGPGHLALFGYDPIKYQVKRGVLSALGIDFKLNPGDVAARGNFCTINEKGLVTDRRAGRIPTEKNMELCELLREIKIPNVKIFVETVKEYRFLLVLRGENLSAEINDTDPETNNKPPIEPKGLSPEAAKTAELIKEFLKQAQHKLRDKHPSNMILLRGFSKKPSWPSMEETYGLKSAAIAAYPMYKGVARLLGMNIIETGEKIREEFDSLEKNWDDYDFFYLHIKKSDSAGEDGDFTRKVEEIEKVDEQIPRLMNLNPDVVVVTGDHSTPSLLKHHSWHPVPLILYSKHCGTDNVKKFDERNCVTGALGPQFPAKNIMPLALANAKRLKKFGA